MEKNKLIIIALIVVIIALLAGVLVSMPNFAKTDSKLEIIGNDTINEGDNLQIKLTDANGTALSNQTVNITITDENKSSDYHSVVTNENGIGELKLEKDAGEYNVTINYAGTDNYNGCNATKKLTIKEKVTEATVEQTSSEPLYLSDTGEPISEADYYTLKVYGKSANSEEEWEAQKASLGY
ncbi:Ig-like domain-containing protein [Methanobrevibacter sp.]|uniref:Ig-like domain-containing protein n=1 Tax=Methanobrevibacter sp. TaxID=66852 RepID=UPI0025FE0237|nr:Ig-like domain-containing protein [Methanobrevibacter sp.]MBQ6511972.1 Ig-like domain-containing protein [Methanobrevibacter sp.]